MSIDLVLEFKESLNVIDFLYKTETVLKQVLKTEDVPQLQIQQLENGLKKPFELINIDVDDACYLISFKNYSHEVLITTISKYGYPSQGMITISIGTTRSESEYILGLCMALSLGLIINTHIIDNINFWTTSDLIYPKIYINYLNSINLNGHDYESLSKCLIDFLGVLE